MEFRDILRDLVNTTSPLAFDTIVLGQTDDNKITMESYTNDKTVVMKAVSNESITDMNGVENFGLSNLNMLQGLLSLNTYKTESTSITPVLKGNQIQKLSFSSDDSSTDFVVLATAALPKQPKLIDKGFDVQVTPSPSKVNELKSYAGVFKTLSEKVTPYTDDNQLRFKVGNAAKNNHGGSIAFAPTKEELTEGYGYSVDRLMQTLSRINNCKSSQISISSKGMMAITIDTGVCQYSFYMMGA
ncbi:hypothetical protein XaC1_344 [Xanthomonas phage XaC1]|nr:hypothetical protein XaC1_344 [Xanthomonas phage XaC1]